VVCLVYRLFFYAFHIRHFFSLKHFIISAFVVLAGIPVSMLLPHYEILIGGIFLGLGLFIPSFVEYRRK
jgi:hypothetical protein